jgi:hypothetical protein
MSKPGFTGGKSRMSEMSKAKYSVVAMVSGREHYFGPYDYVSEAAARYDAYSDLVTSQTCTAAELVREDSQEAILVIESFGDKQELHKLGRMFFPFALAAIEGEVDDAIQAGIQHSTDLRTVAANVPVMYAEDVRHVLHAAAQQHAEIIGFDVASGHQGTLYRALKRLFAKENAQ